MMHNPFSATAENGVGWFLARNGLLYHSGRIIMQLPRAPVRLALWLYWDVWWPSWLSWRMTCNPRTLRLASLCIMAIAIAVARRHV